MGCENWSGPWEFEFSSPFIEQSFSRVAHSYYACSFVRSMRQPFVVRFMKSNPEMNQMILLLHWNVFRDTGLYDNRSKFLWNRCVVARIGQTSNFVAIQSWSNLVGCSMDVTVYSIMRNMLQLRECIQLACLARLAPPHRHFRDCESARPTILDSFFTFCIIVCEDFGIDDWLAQVKLVLRATVTRGMYES
jgi:hypothetical protein